MAIAVLMVDDHPILRQGLRGVLSLEDDLSVVGEAADGESAVDSAMRLRPDVVMMDLRLRGLSGIEATRQIITRSTAEGDGWTPQIIVLTTYEDDDSINEAIEAGASGYLLKSATPDEITAAIRATSLGHSILAPSVATALVRRVQQVPQKRLLSPREIEVLRLMADGLGNTEIAAKLFVEASTVKTHIEHIYVKLGVRRRIQAVAKAQELGLLRDEN